MCVLQKLSDESLLLLFVCLLRLKVVVNAKLMAYGPTTRFMTQIAVTVGNVTLLFDTIRRAANYLEKLNDLLAPVGAKASGGLYDTEIETCDGQRVSIMQMHMDTTYFLNVEYDVPGCHDDLRGILGQMFQCKYGGKRCVCDY